MNAAKIEIGERIRQLRGTLSQGEFSASLGFSRGYLSDIERGKTKPSLEFIIALAAKYDVAVDWVVLGRHVGESEEQGLSSIVSQRGLEDLSESERSFVLLLESLWELYSQADEETKVWIRVQITRAIPELKGRF